MGTTSNRSIVSLLVLSSACAADVARDEARTEQARVQEALTTASNLAVVVGEPQRIDGPVGIPVDSPFLVRRINGVLRGYSANQSTIRYGGPSIESLAREPAPNVAIAGSTSSSAFDFCGAWLHSLHRDGSLVRGWYHAETACDYTTGTTLKSMAYAESTDGGLTFQKVGFPNNRILTNPHAAQTGHNIGSGDATIVKWGSYLYAYFVEWTPTVAFTSIARAPLASGGVPGSWTKYKNGAFTEPGLGGIASSVPNLPGHAVYAHESGSLMGLGGLSVGLSPDATTWTRLSEPLLRTDGFEWVRTPASHELVAYLSFGAPGGGETLGSNVWLFYTYLEPGAGFESRYLVRRQVHLGLTSTTTGPHVRVELTRYYNPTTQQHWVTTTLPVPVGSFRREWAVGHLMTTAQTGAKAIYDCTWGSNPKHYFVGSTASCDGGGTALRTLGWLWTSPRPGTAAIWRCYVPSTGDHFVSGSSTCEGGGTPEFVLGYIDWLGPPLTRYYDGQQHRETTLPTSASFIRQSEEGHVLASATTGAHPLYDCTWGSNPARYFVSKSASCEGGGTNLGVIGHVWDAARDGAAEIFRCYVASNGDHFVSSDPSCEQAGTKEFSLGFLNY